MFSKILSTSLLLASVFFTVAAHAEQDPSMHQVYIAAEAGQFAEAQRMMDVVLRDHPNSAKAHYVEAELLAKQGRTANAAAELQKAETLEPGLPFAKPQSVQHLKQIINGSNSQFSSSYAANSARASSTSWMGLLIGGAVVAAVIFFIRGLFARRAVPNYIPAPNGGSYGSGYGIPPGQTPPVSGGGMGSGIMSGLATGAAVGAGMVAGEALAHHFIDGDGQRRVVDNTYEPLNDNSMSDDMGGNDFGIGDSSSWDDNSFSGGDDNW